ncbi:hypothetical protein LTR08_006597 [Meristemomyces frigidus]|nr:hypothetical protein LTR08_006597 [Meristemomyces frigidus]
MNTLPTLRFHVLAVLISTSLVLSTASAQCYYPDGVSLASDTPCNSSAAVSACCGVQSQCLDNGLCFAQGVLSRGSCTDKDWGDGCAQYCKDSNPGGGMALQACDPSTSSFSCQVNTTDCLDNSNIFVLSGGTNIILRDVVTNGSSTHALAIAPTMTLSIAVDAVVTSVGSAATVTVTAPANSTPSGASEAHYTTADLAGAAVGAGAPLLLALSAALFVIFSQRKKFRQSSPPPQEPQHGYVAGHTPASHYARIPQYSTLAPQHQSTFREMAPSAPVEVSAEQECLELDAREPK